MPATWPRRAVRTLAIATVAGGSAGLVALGVGSRLAMRLAGALAPPQNFGALTEAQANVGIITFGGTLFLLLAGLFMGVPGALLYFGLRRWLPSRGVRRGLAFGVVLLAVFGSRLVEPENPDFALVAHPLLNAASFSLLFLAFGAMVGALVDRFDASFPEWRPVAFVPLAVLAVPLTFFGAATSVFVLATDAPVAYGLLMGGAVVLAGVLAWRLRERASWRVFAFPALVGVAFLARSVWLLVAAG
jgi:hypothetical protein